MKTKLFLTFAAVLFAVTAFSQTAPIKIGYTDVDYILSQLPESKQIEADLAAYQKQLQNQLQAKTQEFEQKYDAYQKGAATMTDIVRADKEEELRNLQSSIQKFSKDADESLQKKQADALKPVYDKIQKAIDDVAKENGYNYIFSSYVAGVPVLLFATEQDNVSELIFKKLGVTPKAATEEKPSVEPKAENKTTAPANNPANTNTPKKK